MVRGGSLCPLSPLSAGTPCGLNLGRLPACELMCVSISPVVSERHRFLGGIYIPWFLQSFHVLFRIAAELGGKGNFLLLMEGYEPCESC